MAESQGEWMNVNREEFGLWSFANQSSPSVRQQFRQRLLQSVSIFLHSVITIFLINGQLNRPLQIEACNLCKLGYFVTPQLIRNSNFFHVPWDFEIAGVDCILFA